MYGILKRIATCFQLYLTSIAFCPSPQWWGCHSYLTRWPTIARAPSQATFDAAGPALAPAAAFSATGRDGAAALEATGLMESKQKWEMGRRVEGNWQARIARWKSFQKSNEDHFFLWICDQVASLFLYFSVCSTQWHTMRLPHATTPTHHNSPYTAIPTHSKKSHTT